CFGAFLVINGLCPLGDAQTGKDLIPKILVIHSYHPEFGWTSGIHAGLRSFFEDKDIRVELKVIYMDTKRHTSETFKKKAALKAKKIIEAWKPDVVIASDDNASKYLIAPYFKNTDLPFVFCGINWDASIYGFPCRNVTGMIEVGLIPQLIEVLSTYAKGTRIGFLAYASLTSRKDAERYKTFYNIELSEKYVETFEAFKKAYADFQEQTDMLIISGDLAGMSDWNMQEAKHFAEKTTTIPSGTIQPPIIFCTLIGYTSVAEEQGEWAAETALRIINGEKPVDIPMVQNKKAKVYLNMTLAKKLGIKFPMELIERSTFVEELNRP
ncbi:MAG: hypothetical protein KKH68_14780, partial [Proteobacteria bacterium]|nr:hypothetical protein [Pseudomonadota bacterium]